MPSKYLGGDTALTTSSPASLILPELTSTMGHGPVQQMAQDMAPHTSAPELLLSDSGPCRQRIWDMAPPPSGPALAWGAASSYRDQASAPGITGPHPRVGQHTNSRTSRALQPETSGLAPQTSELTVAPGTPGPQPCHKQPDTSSGMTKASALPT